MVEDFCYFSHISNRFVVYLILEIIRTLPFLRELRSSISFHVFRGFILFLPSVYINSVSADLMALFSSFRACL